MGVLLPPKRPDESIRDYEQRLLRKSLQYRLASLLALICAVIAIILIGAVAILQNAP